MIRHTDILLPRMGMKMWAVEQVPVFASRVLEIMDGSYWHPGVFKQDQVSISKKTKKTRGSLGFHIQSSKFSSHPSPKSIASSKTPRLKSQDRVDYKTVLWIYNFAEGCSEVETPSEQPKSKPQLGVFRLRYGENGMELAQFDIIDEEFQRGKLWGIYQNPLIISRTPVSNKPKWIQMVRRCLRKHRLCLPRILSCEHAQGLHGSSNSLVDSQWLKRWLKGNRPRTYKSIWLVVWNSFFAIYW